MEEEDYFYCLDCGWEGSSDLADEDDDGALICPECGSPLVLY